MQIYKDKNIGIVLSGGGVRGVAHAGALQALEEYGIEINSISGSSAGAMVGALYAGGCTPNDILDFFKNKARVLRWKCFARSKPGFMDIDKYADLFQPCLQQHTFESLQKSLTICVTDVLNGKVDYLTSGNLIKAVLASAAVPGVFTPVEINGNWYLDGGIMNNFPTEPLLDKCDYLIGSYVNGKNKLTRKDLSNTLKVVRRANDLAHTASSAYKFDHCDLLVNPKNLWKFGMFDSHKVEEIFEIGYQHTIFQLAQKSNKRTLKMAS